MALLAARLGFDAIPIRPDAKIMQVFQAGHDIEDEVLTTMYHVVDRQREVTLEMTKRIGVVGHVDGFDMRDGVLVEVKSQGQVEWDRFEREGWETGFFPKYKWQVSAYMHAYERPLKLIRVKRGKDGERIGDPSVSFVDEPFYSVADIRARILRVEAAAATGVLNAECTPSFPCPYFYLHEDIDRELIDDASLDALAHEYEDARAATKVAEGRQQAARRALREAKEEDKYKTSSGVRVTFYMAKNPPRLEKDLLVPFLEDHGKTLGDFQTQGESERLKVTLPKVWGDTEGTEEAEEHGGG
jgi:hypothetical protein